MDINFIKEVVIMADNKSYSIWNRLSGRKVRRLPKMKARNNRKSKAFTLVELLIVIAIIAVLLAVLVPTLNKVREQTRRVVCASNLKQIGLLLEYYCADNKGFYPPAYSGNYMNCSVNYDPYDLSRERSGLILVLPYLFKAKGNVTSDQDWYQSLKKQEGMERMKIFWCPSGRLQYDPGSWQASTHLSTGYVQYCSRDEGFVTRIGSESVKRAKSRCLEHSPMKNVTHITCGEKSNTGWITFVDISTYGNPIEKLKSNHFKTDTRSIWGPRTRYSACAGANALHVGGNVTWYGPKVMDFTSSKCFMTWMHSPSIGTAYDDWSWWMFPRTE